MHAEANLLKSVLLNLVDNACKASSQGGLVEVLGRRLEDGYVFCVRDYGVGIPEEELKKVTEAFYMVDKSRSRSRNGAGLGLALCVEILRLHGSELEIESTVGEGTCISFVIPDRQEAAAQEEGARDKAEPGRPEPTVDKAGIGGAKLEKDRAGSGEPGPEPDGAGSDEFEPNQDDGARGGENPDVPLRDRAGEDGENEDWEEELGEA